MTDLTVKDYIEKARAYTASEFMLSLVRQYDKKGILSERQITALKNAITRAETKATEKSALDDHADLHFGGISQLDAALFTVVSVNKFNNEFGVSYRTYLRDKANRMFVTYTTKHPFWENDAAGSEQLIFFRVMDHIHIANKAVTKIKLRQVLTRCR